ncbi:hypothetical protein QUF63_03580 [Anaerolineales bacterium HSG25]|nr:hypothetical protein [Anaerolineales bacterium HSG25]
MYHPILQAEAQQQLKQIHHADLVIGLPSYKNPSQAAYVARMALHGAAVHYPNLRTVLVNADAGFDPLTRQAVLGQALNNGYQAPVISGRYNGPFGRGNAIAAILDAALALDAQAIIILDSNSCTLTPNWTAGLAHLLLTDKADLVVPRYQWLLPASALSDLFAYPLFRVLWGQSLRHPIAPDFALSPRLATAMLDEDVWETAVSGFGLPAWATTYATLHNWRVAQTALGTKHALVDMPSLVNPLKPGLPIANDWPIEALPMLRVSETQISETILQSQPTFEGIVSTMFHLIRYHRANWNVNRRRFRSCSTLTEFSTPTLPPLVPNINLTFLLDNLAIGWIEYRRLWKQILTPNNMTSLESIASLSPDDFYFPTDLWTRIVYDFIVGFNRSELDPRQIVKALFPIYQGRLAAYWQQVIGLSSIACEGTVSAQAVEFEELREYLKLRWRTY